MHSFGFQYEANIKMIGQKVPERIKLLEFEPRGGVEKVFYRATGVLKKSCSRIKAVEEGVAFKEFG